MEYVAPIAAFLFFLGLMALQARRRGNPYGDVPAPTPHQRRVARAFQVAMLVGWALLMAAVIGSDDLLPLLVPSGLLFIAGGLVFQVDRWGLRDALTRLDAHSTSARVFGVRNVTPWWGLALMVVGAAFLAVGVGAVAT